MYNLNTSLTTPLLGVDISQTPRTPEILNSLIAMTNPLEYSLASLNTGGPSNPVNLGNNHYSTGNEFQMLNVNKDSSFLHQLDTQSNCSSSSVESPATTPTTPSLQQTRSQLIKAGVKMLIQNKRKHSVSTSSNDQPPAKQFISSTYVSSPASVSSSEVVPSESFKNQNQKISKTDSTTSCDEDSESKQSTGNVGLTPEDEDRRRRRRERNKIAATKCRLKKREKTLNLVNESEILEKQNIDLKNQLSDLESQRIKLTEMLRLHRMECVNQHLIRKSRSYEEFKLNPSSYQQKIKTVDETNNDNNNNETKHEKCNMMENIQPSVNNHLPNNNIADDQLPSFMTYKFMNEDTTSSHNIFDFGIEMFNSEEDDFQKHQDNEWEVKYSHTLQNNSNNGMHPNNMMSQNMNPSHMLYQQNLNNGAPHLSHVQIKNEHDQQTLHEVKC